MFHSLRAGIGKLNFQQAASVSATAGIGAALYILHKYVFPFRDLHSPPLPAEWNAFDEGTAKVILKEHLSCCEDVLLDHETGQAVISADPGRPQWNTVMVRASFPKCL